jgi:hypothetical protein
VIIFMSTRSGRGALGGHETLMGLVPIPFPPLSFSQCQSRQQEEDKEGMVGVIWSSQEVAEMVVAQVVGVGSRQHRDRIREA